jgi:hypothetical protein
MRPTKIGIPEPRANIVGTGSFSKRMAAPLGSAQECQMSKETQ